MTNGEYPPPTPSTVRQLYGSAFRCAHPKCSRPLYKVTEDTGDLVLNSRVAHIHARREGGPRWIDMSGAENRAFDNLLLLCIEHSYEIDDAWELFPAEMLREWKAAQIAEYNRLQRNWPINEDEATEVLFASESFDALHASSTIELARLVEAFRLAAERTRDSPRSWSRLWQGLIEKTRRSPIAWDQDGNSIYAEPSDRDLDPIRDGFQSALTAAMNELRPAAEAARIELAAVRVTRTQVTPWCDAVDSAITRVMDEASTWKAGPDPTADKAFDTAIADLKRTVAALVQASRGENVEVPTPPPAGNEHKDVDPLADHRRLLDEARPFSRVDHRSYDPELYERVADATRQAARLPPTMEFIAVGLAATAHLAMDVAGNASESERIELVKRDRQRLPICAAAALLEGVAAHGDGQSPPAIAAHEQMRRLWSETDWSNSASWVGNDVNGHSMMHTFARATSDEEVRDRLAQALKTDPNLLGPLVVSGASWVEDRDHRTWKIVGVRRNYREVPSWLPFEIIKALAVDLISEADAKDDGLLLQALLNRLDC